MTPDRLAFSVPPFRLSGVVVGALLNDPAELAALGEALHQPPYKAPPQAPVLGVKPRNTWAFDGDAVAVPAEGVVLAAQLGLVIGLPCCRVPEARALAHVAGYTLALDLHLPLASHYRPAARQRVRDGFCPLGPAVLPAAALAEPEALVLQVQLDGQTVHLAPCAGRSRGVARLVADVSQFMTLAPGDLLLLGAAAGAPLGHAGQQVRVQALLHGAPVPGLGPLGVQLVPEQAPAPAAGPGLAPNSAPAPTGARP